MVLLPTPANNGENVIIGIFPYEIVTRVTSPSFLLHAQLFLPFRFKRTSGTMECRDIHVFLFSSLRWDFFYFIVWDDFTAGSCLTKNDKATLMTRMDAGRFEKPFFALFFFQQPPFFHSISVELVECILAAFLIDFLLCCYAVPLDLHCSAEKASVNRTGKRRPRRTNARRMNGTKTILALSRKSSSDGKHHTIAVSTPSFSSPAIESVLLVEFLQKPAKGLQTGCSFA